MIIYIIHIFIHLFNNLLIHFFLGGVATHCQYYKRGTWHSTGDAIVRKHTVCLLNYFLFCPLNVRSWQILTPSDYMAQKYQNSGRDIVTPIDLLRSAGYWVSKFESVIFHSSIINVRLSLLAGTDKCCGESAGIVLRIFA